MTEFGGRGIGALQHLAVDNDPGAEAASGINHHEIGEGFGVAVGKPHLGQSGQFGAVLEEEGDGQALAQQGAHLGLKPVEVLGGDYLSGGAVDIAGQRDTDCQCPAGGQRIDNGPQRQMHPIEEFGRVRNPGYAGAAEDGVAQIPHGDARSGECDLDANPDSRSPAQLERRGLPSHLTGGARLLLTHQPLALQPVDDIGHRTGRESGDAHNLRAGDSRALPDGIEQETFIGLP